MRAPRIRHNGWLIEQSIDGFEATHPDYDPEHFPQRFVMAETLEELAQAIEDYISEHGA